jgi:hypothetical protein
MSPLPRGFFDFSPLYDETEVPEICTQSAEIASRLIQSDNFFENKICKGLAKFVGLSEPTPEEMQSIRDNLGCKVNLTHGPDSYMQCATDSADIFINDQVPTPF